MANAIARVVVVASSSDGDGLLKQLGKCLDTVHGAHVIRLEDKIDAVAAMSALAMKAMKALELAASSALQELQSVERESAYRQLPVDIVCTLHFTQSLLRFDCLEALKAFDKLELLMLSATAGPGPASQCLDAVKLDPSDLMKNPRRAEVLLTRIGELLSITPAANRERAATELLGYADADIIPLLAQLGPYWLFLVEMAEEAGRRLSEDGQLEQSLARLSEFRARITSAIAAFSDRGVMVGAEAVLAICTDQQALDGVAMFRRGLEGALVLAEAAMYGLASGVAAIMAADVSAAGGRDAKKLRDKAVESEKKSRAAIMRLTAEDRLTPAGE
jgi:hypothetical protein